MPKTPRVPEDIFSAFRDDYAAVFGDDLVSIILYGSGARGDYLPGKSDLNFLIVLQEAALGRVREAMSLVRRWQGRGVATPLFLSPGDIASSQDTFPIEFLNMQAAYTVVAGKDVLGDVHCKADHIRLQCERELKAKLLQLRERYLDTRDRRRQIEALIRESLPAFFSIFQAMLALQGTPPEKDRARLLAETARVIDLDVDLFSELAAIRAGQKKLSRERAPALMERYIAEVGRIAAQVDTMYEKG